MANYINEETLLRDKRVLAEIDRHLWIESEKAGTDIGFDQAKEDWLKKFSRAWMSYHMPEVALKELKAERNDKASNGSAVTKKRRSAKSYFK
jgi:hypothetical protein